MTKKKLIENHIEYLYAMGEVESKNQIVEYIQRDLYMKNDILIEKCYIYSVLRNFSF